MFTPPRCFNLFKIWEQLIYEGFDPIVEYNKTIQEFSRHFPLTNRQLFIILFSFSRFFLELSDLENSRTPDYKHPLIRPSQ